ncbi:hypothetical protein FE634_21390 [Nocardioides dongxiaopingii]|uniref:hypothetical protein n=1 Tax=Nocardioides sp. S-1144 TaxID=2582905 RepID=UPI001162171F|nr:hypothetical protein [Nocardioides sp. S-1144]QDH10640.1 hypothetical protein FE634_21390 [Nocardioides sp. S-1144]
MFDDLSDLSLDTDLLEALAELDLGDGAVSAHDANTISQVLDDSLQEVPGDFVHLSPEATSVLQDALGFESDALGGFGPDAVQIEFVDPFGEVPEADAGSAMEFSDLTDGIYTDAQATYADLGMDTDVGYSFLPVEDQAFAWHVPEFPGEYVLDTHGTADFVAVDGVALSAPDFAEVVAHETDWTGEPIRLFSCNTGEEAGGFAQQLANELGTEVTAPTEQVWSVQGGEPVIGSGVFDPVAGCFLPAVPPSGEWLTFLPQVV